MPFENEIRQSFIEQIIVTQGLLARFIDKSADKHGDFATAIPNLSFFRREHTTEPESCLVEPSVLLVSQGKKQMWVGEQPYVYDLQQFLITSLDLPAKSQVVDADADNPCLGLMLKIDLQVITELIAQIGLPPSNNQETTHAGIGISMVTLPMLDSFKRLLSLLDQPNAIKVLAPLVEREIYYHLLMSDQAKRLWQIASVGSQSHRVAKAIEWLKLNFDQPLHVDELAARVQMSTSNLHHHFRKLTAMSPLQYQKWLRLNEAKRLMLNEFMDAASAAFEVGYESPSQFGREYSRMFGCPPKRDIMQIRNQLN